MKSKYTIEIELHSPFCDGMNLFVKPGTDYDTAFKAYDAEEDGFVYVHGYNFSITEV